MTDTERVCKMPFFRNIMLVCMFGAVGTVYAGDGPHVPSYPRDVQSFVQDRDLCDHLRGEIPDQQPGNEEGVNEAVAAANKACKGTDARLDALNAKYANDPQVLQKLKTYEEHIEAN